MLVPKSVCALSSIASCNSTRHSLSGVLLGRDAAGLPSAKAADRQRMFIAEWTDFDCADYPDIGLDIAPRPGFSAIVPAKPFGEAARLPTKRSVKPLLKKIAVGESADRLITLAATDLETVRRLDTKPVEGAFPEFADIEREHDNRKVVKVLMNAAMLAETLKTLLATAPGADADQVVEIEVPLAGHHPIKLTRKGKDVKARAYQCPGVPQEE